MKQKAKQILLNDMVEKENGIPQDIVEFYNNLSNSILNHIRKRNVRKYSDECISSWLNLKFSINRDPLIHEIHKLAAEQITKFHLRQNSNYRIPLNEIYIVIDIINKYKKQEKEAADKFEKLKYDTEILRRNKYGPKKERKPKVIKPKIDYYNPDKIISIKTKLHFKQITYEDYYNPWMEHVKSKSTSRSYWYIHEYIARNMLTFAIEMGEPRITQSVADHFLEDYCRGKRPKTINHYTRVAKYFVEFCSKL